MLYLSKLRSYWVSILPMTGASIQQQKSASYKTVNTPGLVVSMRELRVKPLAFGAQGASYTVESA